MRTIAAQESGYRIDSRQTALVTSQIWSLSYASTGVQRPWIDRPQGAAVSLSCWAGCCRELDAERAADPAIIRLRPAQSTQNRPSAPRPLCLSVALSIATHEAPFFFVQL
jgi:hypothetical protein